MRRSLKKQLITTVLSMGIVISLLSGCGDQKETKSTTKKADVTQSADQEAKDPGKYRPCSRRYLCVGKESR